MARSARHLELRTTLSPFFSVAVLCWKNLSRLLNGRKQWKRTLFGEFHLNKTKVELIHQCCEFHQAGMTLSTHLVSPNHQCIQTHFFSPLSILDAVAATAPGGT